MQGFISWLLTILACVLAVPTATLCLEILAAIFKGQDYLARPRPNPRRRVAVVVPARNESATISPTLNDIKTQLNPGDVLLVVADNCTDNTAEIARSSGAEVVERHDANRIGKGYALDWGLRHLEANAPDIVVMIDADCRVTAGTIDQLVSACSMTGRPVQALYLMTAPDGSQVNHQIAEFAWRVKNWARPVGLSAFHLPCQLMGAGMAFPWQVIRAADLASASIVEDLKLGLELTAAGHPPLFCSAAIVTSHFAASARGADIQRRRWEHGHIVTILRKAPHFLSVAVARANFNLLALTLDLLVPPLSLLAMLLMLMFLFTGAAALLGLGSTALVISAACLVGFAATVGLAWQKYGHSVLPSRSILLIPGYIFGKLGLYRQVLFGKMTARWIGTDRAKP
jgi:cellulose synthase/poly-beta-1,6-N-acetylglucosamine synthase-like glycosyltransferase